MNPETVLIALSCKGVAPVGSVAGIFQNSFDRHGINGWGFIVHITIGVKAGSGFYLIYPVSRQIHYQGRGFVHIVLYSLVWQRDNRRIHITRLPV